ncbi:PREDICTED: mitogen-activated protein kinase 15, partial [Condylura cristata]|uniref:mitogen-activated protein kinase 15 n=1 Tax=Condylura cristata TaxID=143302 RepID=UPI00064376F1
MCAAEVERRVAQRYLLKRRLGRGAYGIVWKAVDRRTGEVVAIKKISDAFRDETDAQRTFREVALLQEFQGHPNIIRLLDVIPAENDRDIYLVFEPMGGRTLLSSPPALPACPGVDMWSLGCILGEMLRGRPLFPGTSTIHQLELILETVPPPSQEDLLALGASYSAPTLQHLGPRPRQTLDALLPPDTPPEALDLLQRLLVFAPGKRLSAAQALRHPYVRRFHCPAREWSLQAPVQLPVHEAARLPAAEYRHRLHQMVLARCKKGLGAPPQPHPQERPCVTDDPRPGGATRAAAWPRPHPDRTEAPTGAK